MIQANELRIGNWVEIDQYGNTRNIIRIDSGSDIDQVVKLRPLPIPLSPEILENVGFKKDDDRQPFEQLRYYHPNTLIFSMNTKYPSGRWQAVRNLSEGGIIICDKVNYLHQLQNLYFSLTGEELTFKP